MEITGGFVTRLLGPVGAGAIAALVGAFAMESPLAMAIFSACAKAHPTTEGDLKLGITGGFVTRLLGPVRAGAIPALVGAFAMAIFSACAKAHPTTDVFFSD